MRTNLIPGVDVLLTRKEKQFVDIFPKQNATIDITDSMDLILKKDGFIRSNSSITQNVELVIKWPINRERIY